MYYITCNTCKETLDPEIKEIPAKPGGIKSDHYIGMSAVTLHNRQKTHREQHAARNKNSALVKHEVEKHNGLIQSYTARMITTDKGLLHTSLREALLISGQIRSTSMNDRMEKGKGMGIVRISTEGVT